MEGKKDQKTRIQYFISEIIFACIIGVLILCFLHTDTFDQIICLEERYPSYWLYLGKAVSIFAGSDSLEENNESYVLTNVYKNGFGDIAGEDIKLYLNAMKSQYPQAAVAFLCFEDETAVRIPFRSQNESAYGKLMRDGSFEVDRIVDLSIPLSSQIDGLTVIRREFNEYNNSVHEIYLDQTGNVVENLDGVAECFREYDSCGNIVWEKCLDSRGLPVLNSSGTAEIRRVYDGINIIEESFYDERGNLTLSNNGYAIVESDYDDANRLVEQRYYDIDGQPLRSTSGYYAVSQKWDNKTLIERIYLGEDGEPVERTDGYYKVAWMGGNDGNRKVHFYDLDDREIELCGINLVTNVKIGNDGWSEWISPRYDEANSCIDIGFVNLGENHEDDVYTCQLEVEFSNVQVDEGYGFRFLTQGAQDGEWNVGNVWNASLVYITDVPENGIYTYTTTQKITEDMTHISRFNIGFRCDYWSSGSFRVRKVKIEKGDTATEWTPGI